MGCGASLSSPVLPPPVEGQANKFILKKPMMGSGVNVLNTDKEKWLSISTEGDFGDNEPTMSIKTRDSEPMTLASMTFEPTETVFDEADSDDSDYSDDDLFAFEDGENLAKIKLKTKRKAKLMDADGAEVGSVSWKVKSKARAVSEVQQATVGDVEEDGIEVRASTWLLTVDAKIKKEFFKINYRGKDLKVEMTPNGKWWLDEGKCGGEINMGAADKGPKGGWEHSWKSDLFAYEYNAKFGTDEVIVDLPASDSPPGELILLGHAVADFLHPCQKKISENVWGWALQKAKDSGLKH